MFYLKFIAAYVMACFGLWLITCEEIVNNSGNVSDVLGVFCIVLAFYMTFRRKLTQ